MTFTRRKKRLESRQSSDFYALKKKNKCKYLKKLRFVQSGTTLSSGTVQESTSTVQGDSFGPWGPKERNSSTGTQIHWIQITVHWWKIAVTFHVWRTIRKTGERHCCVSVWHLNIHHLQIQFAQVAGVRALTDCPQQNVGGRPRLVELLCEQVEELIRRRSPLLISR